MALRFDKPTGIPQHLRHSLGAYRFEVQDGTPFAQYGHGITLSSFSFQPVGSGNGRVDTRFDPPQS